MSLDLQDTVSVDFKGDFNLWDPSSCWRNSSHVEFTQLMIIFGQCPFSLVDRNSHSALLISVSGKGLTFLGWDEGPFRNDFGHDSSNSFDSKS